MPKTLIAFAILAALFYSTLGAADLKNQPLPASPAYRPALSAEELQEAIPLQKERIRVARKLQGYGAYPAADLKLLESTLAKLQSASPDAEAPDVRTVQPAYPFYLQSDAAAAAYGLEKLQEMYPGLVDEVERQSLLYKRGKGSLLKKLEAQAELHKAKRAIDSLKAGTPLNSTLQAAPLFLQSANNLSKLSAEELNDLQAIHQERRKRSIALFGKDSLSVKELDLGLKRLEKSRMPKQ